MSLPVVIPNIFQGQAGPLPLSEFDDNWSEGAAALNDVATYSQYFADTSGAANTVTITVPAPQTFGYTTGISLTIRIGNTTSTTTPAINVNGLGPKTIANADGTPLFPGQLISGGIYTLVFFGGLFRLVSMSTALSGTVVGTLTGYLVNLTGNVNWVRTGFHASIYVPANITGISNTTGMTLTGLPVVIRPLSQQVVACASLEDNTITNLIGDCVIGTGGTVAFRLALATGATGPIQVGTLNFTASGTKGILSGFSITYPVG